MRPVLKPVCSPFTADSIERILSRYFARLTEWGQILTRGDQTAAEEIVQDLCLHLTVAQPDLSAVNDLDAYLYTCLRNMYVSRLARISRERLRVIQVEDYDAVGVVINGSGPDSVDVQNELISISDYVMSRKYSSKSASHFILHFFLGYRRSDVAVLARLPIAASIAHQETRPAMVFGVGTEYDVSRHFSVRAEYRGLFYKMPDFAIDNGFPKQRLFSVTNTPAISLVYRFRSPSNNKQLAKIDQDAH